MSDGVLGKVKKSASPELRKLLTDRTYPTQVVNGQRLPSNTIRALADVDQTNIFEKVVDVDEVSYIGKLTVGKDVLFLCISFENLSTVKDRRYEASISMVIYTSTGCSASMTWWGTSVKKDSLVYCFSKFKDFKRLLRIFNVISSCDSARYASSAEEYNTVTGFNFRTIRAELPSGGFIEAYPNLYQTVCRAPKDNLGAWMRTVNNVYVHVKRSACTKADMRTVFRVIRDAAVVVVGEQPEGIDSSVIIIDDELCLASRGGEKYAGFVDDGAVVPVNISFPGETKMMSNFADDVVDASYHLLTVAEQLSS